MWYGTRVPSADMAAKYTDEQKAEAVAVYTAEGMAAAHNQTGVPKPSIKRWADEQGATAPERSEQTKAATAARQLEWAERQPDVVRGFALLAQVSVEQALLAAMEGQSSKAKDFATTAAISVDKAALLSGEPTERRELTERRDAMLRKAKENAQGLRAVPDVA